MRSYKRIERSIGDFIGARYRNAAEIGIGTTPEAAEVLAGAGKLAVCTDIRSGIRHPGMPVVVDDIFEPDISLYRGVDVIYAIRPGVEMVPPLIDLARRLDVDLLVYHLGCEIYENGGEIVEPATCLRRYHRGTYQKSVD
ncbi:hypothetical protein FGU65_04725 [Methanoculleus sp. FWC-SCC1]|uniref:UPF0146 protein FGU65_04725 n=1 Tax=Methanoculleus frigidifontis TaxID=2584085 RepID=A0ABT8M8G7_9EURY|nr:UPF0146 family protein [Methanoculleus sp. FWC-SCC1]MDN7024199.1 hypothetical protein [Methanoculleus sp. FWC-SCC1]